MIASLNSGPATETWLEIVRQRVEAMRFGSVQIVVHEGRVTQVESTEKTRLPDPEAPLPNAKRKN
jgi:hypothetical protein